MARSDAVAGIRRAWSRADSWRVGRWLIMPDHVHLFCAPATIPPEPLRKWIAFWKSESSRAWTRPAEHPIWQRDFWDKQLRNGESYRAKWLYVCQNPVRAGLVSREEDWPFQGEENVLFWTD